MIYVREIKSPDGIILILCDKDLYGKEIREGEVVLKINKFYKGKEVKDLETEILEKAYLINAIGKESINILMEKKILDQEDLKNIKYVKNVPYVFIIRE
jgi:hypothetical protein